MASRFRLALVQLFVDQCREVNLARVPGLIREAAKHGAQVVVLPEYFTCWMDPKYFIEYKEPYDGPSSQMLSKAAKDNHVYLFGGTFPEAIPNSEKLYNTCHIYSPRGELMAHYRKLHLFDVDLGPKMNIIETGFGVCIDLRFPELARLYSEKGCQLLTYMGGFSQITGPHHWEILQRVRAVDNQMFVASVGPATNTEAPYVTYGHSGVADPWGDIIAKTGADEDIVYADIDLSLVGETRRKMPLDKIRRDDLYRLEDLSEK